MSGEIQQTYFEMQLGVKHRQLQEKNDNSEFVGRRDGLCQIYVCFGTLFLRRATLLKKSFVSFGLGTVFNIVFYL